MVVSLGDLRQTIERQLAELDDERQRLQAALQALGAGDTPPTPQAPAKVPRPRAPANRQAPKPKSKATVRGGTRQAVLDALSDGSAMTAGDIAKATGRGRGSVSTTLSNLLAAGQVLKAARGYKTPASDASAPASSTPSTATPTGNGADRAPSALGREVDAVLRTRT